MTISKFLVNNNSKRKSTVIDAILSLFVFLILIILLTNPKHYANSTLQGLLLFTSAVLPGLFPFMFLTKILTSLNAVKMLSNKSEKLTQRLFNCPGISSYSLIMSSISGYPIGARIIGDLHSNRLITNSEAQKMITFSMTSGPIFIIGTVGSAMFGDIKVGIIIMISHLISSILTGIIFCKLKKPSKDQLVKNITPPINTYNIVSIDKVISESMYQSVISILIVGGFISIFYCFTEILIQLKIFNILCLPLAKIFELCGVSGELSYGVMSGIIEVTRGCKELSILYPLYPRLTTSLASAIISFSGISIIFQSKAMLSSTNIKTHFLILSKSVHAIICFIICLLLSLIMI